MVQSKYCAQMNTKDMSRIKIVKFETGNTVGKQITTSFDQKKVVDRVSRLIPRKLYNF